MLLFSFAFVEIILKNIFSSFASPFLLTPAILVFTSFFGVSWIWVLLTGILFDAMGSFQFGFFTVLFLVTHILVILGRKTAYETTFSAWFIVAFSILIYQFLGVFLLIYSGIDLSYSLLKVLILELFIQQVLIIILFFSRLLYNHAKIRL